MPCRVPLRATQAEEAERACAGGYVLGRLKVYSAGTGVSGRFWAHAAEDASRHHSGHGAARKLAILLA
jgi:hypothetical protein